MMNNESGSEPFDHDFIASPEEPVTDAEAQSELRAGHSEPFNTWFRQQERTLGEQPTSNQRSTLYMHGARLHYMAGDIEGSIKLLNKAIEIDPTQKKHLTELMDLIDHSQKYHKK